MRECGMVAPGVLGLMDSRWWCLVCTHLDHDCCLAPPVQGPAIHPTAPFDCLLVGERSENREHGTAQVQRSHRHLRVRHRQHHHDGALQDVGEGVRQGRREAVKHREARKLVAARAEAVKQRPANGGAPGAGVRRDGRRVARIQVARLKKDDH
eukprot:scaffold5586_cov124-Isochrysis_galbana.AAC.18